MPKRKTLFVPAIVLLLVIQTAGALNLDIPVGGDIQAAIDEVSAAGGGTVNLAAGTHQMSTSIRSRSDVTLRRRLQNETTA